MESGDNPKGFTNIRCFQALTPLASISSIGTYNGYFPVGDYAVDAPGLFMVSPFEVQEDSKNESYLNQIGYYAPWLSRSTDKVELFHNYLSNFNLDKAWLALNSRGWRIKDARSALEDLAQTANDPIFSTLAEAWLSIADIGVGSY